LIAFIALDSGAPSLPQRQTKVFPHLQNRHSLMASWPVAILNQLGSSGGGVAAERGGRLLRMVKT